MKEEKEKKELDLTIEDEMKNGMRLEFLPGNIGRVLIKRPHHGIVRLYISEVNLFFSKRFTVGWDKNARKYRATISGSARNFAGPSFLAVLDGVRSFK